MAELYVYDNTLLGDNGADFNDSSCVDCIYADSAEECLAIFEGNYSSNDYSMSFVGH